MLGDQLRRVSLAGGAVLRLEGLLGFCDFSLGLGLVSDVLGPGVGWGCPGAVVLDAEVVDASDQPECSVFSPVGAPGVPYDPVFDSIFFSPASDADIVILLDPSGVIDEDASGVVPESIGDCQRAGDGSSLVNLVDHRCFSLHGAEFIDSVDLGPLLRPASLPGEAVLALDLVTAAHSVIMTEGLVGRAGLISDVVVVDPLVRVFGIASAAAIVIGAGDEHLGSEVDIGPLGLPPDFDAVGEGGGGCEGPAGATVNGDVLVALDSEVVGSVDVAPPEGFGELLEGKRLDGAEHAGLEGLGGSVHAILRDIHGECQQDQQA